MRYEVVNLAEGWAGTDATVRKINEIVAASLVDPVVVQTARDLVRHLPERDKDAEIEAVSRFVRGKIRYTNEAVETISTPRVLLDEIRRHGRAVGDCDDHVVLWLALHRALGNRVRVKVISQRKNKRANHIYGQVWSPRRGWVTDELIVKHRPLGWEVPARGVTKEKVYGSSFGGFGMHDVFAPPEPTEDLFVPGGAAQMMVDPFLASVPRMVSRNHVPSRYNVKRGGMLETREDGSVGAVGFIPGVVAVAAPLTKLLKPKKLLKMFGKKKKKKAKREPAAPAAACPPGYYYAGTSGVDDIYEAGMGMGDIYEAGMGQVPPG